MARIERIKQRLDNWALWRIRLDSNSLGFHTRSVLAVDVWERGTYNGARIPHFDEEAEETDRAVKAMKNRGKDQLVSVVQMFYIENYGVTEIAYRLGKSHSTIHANLGAADREIHNWLCEQRKERMSGVGCVL